MTAEAAEIGTVADSATGLVEVQVARAVGAHESSYMADRFEVIAFSVALFATERVVDLAVANEAVGHFGHVEGGDLGTFFQGSMTGMAGVSSVQVAADIARGLEVLFLVDGGGDGGGQVAHFEVLQVAEMSHRGGRGTRDVARFVAGLAGFWAGEQVVGWGCTGGGCSVTGGALNLQLEMELMRKGRGDCGRCAHYRQK